MASLGCAKSVSAGCGSYKDPGSIHLIVGPMFARKTTTMLAEIERNLIARKRCVIIKHKSDTRYDHLSDTVSVSTHAGNVFKDCPIYSAESLSKIDVSGYLDGVNVVGISEGQFYDDLAQYADKWADMGLKVIIEGLSGDFQQHPFQPIVDVTPLASSVLTLHAVCMRCYNDNGCFTIRTTNETAQKVVGGKDKYIAVCRKCRREFKEESLSHS